MISLIDRMKQSDAKSSPKVSLFDHCKGVLEIVNHMISLTPDYSAQKASILRLGAFLHDIGKLHPDFQKMLNFSYDTKLERIKHEAQTFEFYEAVENDMAQVAGWISEELDCEMEVPEDFADIFAFAVTHHGLFYSSYEKGIWQARREWTKMSPDEERRITLADLLIRYYPLGGAVIFADMLHSEELASGRNNIEEIRKMNSASDLRKYVRLRQNELLQIKEEDRKLRIPLDLLELLIS